MRKLHPQKADENNDFISEEEFTNQIQDVSTDPQEDSPGDSEKDAGVEFSMGMGYQPDESDGQLDSAEDIRSKASAMERPNDLVFTPAGVTYRIPNSAMVKSSEQPAPWEDRDRSSSSN